MKFVKPTVSLLLAGMLSLSVISCSQIESGGTISEGTSSSLPESSGADVSLPEVSQPTSSQPEETASVPENTQSSEPPAQQESSAASAEETNNQYEEYWNDEYGREQLIGAYGKIRLMFQYYVGEDNYNAWNQQALAEGKQVNIRTFVDHFGIDQQTFLSIIYDVYENDTGTPWKEIYATKEDFLHSMYSDQQVDAIFHGDDAALREAFHFPADYPVT